MFSLTTHLNKQNKPKHAGVSLGCKRQQDRHSVPGPTSSLLPSAAQIMPQPPAAAMHHARRQPARCVPPPAPQNVPGQARGHALVLSPGPLAGPAPVVAGGKLFFQQPPRWEPPDPAAQRCQQRALCCVRARLAGCFGSWLFYFKENSSFK